MNHKLNVRTIKRWHKEFKEDNNKIEELKFLYVTTMDDRNSINSWKYAERKMVELYLSQEDYFDLEFTIRGYHQELSMIKLVTNSCVKADGRENFLDSY